MKYEKLRTKLKTGDIVLFSGKGFVSWLIKWFTKSKWSHVGMAMRILDYDMVLLWESTTLTKTKDIHGKSRSGVRIVPLSKALANYKGEVGIRYLLTNKGLNKDVLAKMRNEFTGRKYEQNMLQLFKSAYDWTLGKNKRDMSSVFCSELIAEAYQRLGYLSTKQPSNEYTPDDFGADIQLLAGAELGEIIEVEV